MNETLLVRADRRFRAAAAAEGLLDVAYDVVDSPVGRLLSAVTPRGVCRIAFDGEDEAELETLSQAHGARILRSPRALDPLRRQLDDYFGRRLRSFEVEVDLVALPPFQRLVLEELVRVPYGTTDTYGALAARLGKPRAARAVGGALNRNPVPIVVPCHRIVGGTGSLVGYAGGLERKRALLELEGAAA